ncbi:DUF885 domain-containing protein [Gallaecimonas kandeliae]|uniref:DUF885 domain-containing protein n=1 Tax=Gallaecimonas kandeliae TaxID=3029055 RepID=UPI0026484515|nr:DUF885 domain-containing protein [Gallaecimonas kandeliae]WKE66653.1 DUF885 domain-containing protein [Gallaecimonas kandeliae]
MKKSLLLLSLASCLAVAEPAWVTQSNQYAQPVLEEMAKYNPEMGSFLGLEAYDDKVVDLGKGVYERSRKGSEAVLAKLKAELAKEKDPRVKQDLGIMVETVERNLASGKLQHDEVLPFYNVGESVFSGLQSLLDERNSAERKAKAVARLRAYAGLDGHDSLVSEAEARTEERLGDQKLIGPYKPEVEQALANSPRFLAGIKQLFEANKLDGWQQAYDQLAKQLTGYDAWVKSTIMPRARTSNVMPEALYSDALKNYGVMMPPRELMERALFGFAEIRDEMQSLATQIAKKEGFKNDDYRDVIRELKKRQVTGKAILPFYKKRLADIEEMVRDHHIVTLPERKASIRLASEAESASQPAPHMNPPRLIGNKGEYGEFVLPLNDPNAKGHLDDFTNEAFSWTLTVHEARPGHELQFAKMVENGVSQARGIFAFNSANVEGWALYSEAIMKQYLPLDGQLFSLQARLQRAARAFLDPMLNLGMISPEDARKVLTDEVVLSAPFAAQEVDRYTFRAPGQATSYYYGYMKLRELRAQVELKLKDKFNQQAYHDFILSQGLLPPDLLEKAVMEEFVPKYL